MAEDGPLLGDGTAAPAPRASASSTLGVLRWLLVLECAAVGLGLLTRTLRFLDARSLWLDEATLSLEILDHDFAELTQPLGRNQVASLGFLWLQKAATLLLGEGELALRTVPFVAGCLGLVLFWRLARGCFAEHRCGTSQLGRHCVWIAVLAFALCDSLVYYSTEAKQYSLDVLAAIALLLVRGMPRPEAPSARSSRGFVLVGTLALVCSQPAIFVVAALGCAELWRSVPVAERRRSLAPFGVLAAVFLATYFLHDRPAAGHPELARYWAPDFPPAPVSAEALAWYPRHLFGYFHDPAAFPLWWLAAALFVLGVLHEWRGDRARAVLLVAPPALVLLASFLRLHPFPGSFLNALSDRVYPYVGRTLLFTLPTSLLAIPAGVAAIASGRRSARSTPRTVFAAVAVLALLGPNALQAAHNTVDPPRVQEMRPLYARVRAAERPGDWFFAQTLAGPVLEYYHRRAVAGTADEGRPWWPIPASTTSAEGMHAFYEALSRIGPDQRLWLVSLGHPNWPAQEEPALVQILSRLARPLERFEEEWASATLFQIH